MSLYLGKRKHLRRPIRIPPERHQVPIHLLGLARVGKSTLLANLALQLNAAGEGVIVLDHKDGQLAKDIVTRCDPARLRYISPGQCYFNGQPHHWGLNVLEVKHRDRLGFDMVADHAVGIFELMERAEFRLMAQMGYYLDQATRLALYLPTPTILDVRRILTEQAFRKQLLVDPRIPDELRESWSRFDDNKQMTPYSRSGAVNSSIPRLKSILTVPSIYYMVTQPTSTIHLQEWLDDGMMVVVDTATDMSQGSAKLLADLVLALLINETFARRQPERVWRLVADEFDQLAASNMYRLIDKAGAYKVYPLMAHQTLAQLYRSDDPKLYDSVIASPIKFTFRVGPSDTQRISWAPTEELTNLPRYQAYVTHSDGVRGLLDAGKPELLLLDPLPEGSPKTALADAIASQYPHTVAERLLKGATMEVQNDQNATHPLQDISQPLPPGDDSDGVSDAVEPPPVSSLDELAGVQTPLPESPQQRRSTPRRRRRKSRNKPLQPQAPQGRRTGTGQADSPAGESNGQVGDESPDSERLRGTEGPQTGFGSDNEPLP